MIDPDTPKGTKVRVHFNGKCHYGTVVENVYDNDICIIVRTDEKIHDKSFLDGHGISVGYRSDDVRYLEMTRNSTRDLLLELKRLAEGEHRGYSPDDANQKHGIVREILDRACKQEGLEKFSYGTFV